MICHFVFILLLPLILARNIPERLTARDECSAPVRDTCTFYRNCLEARYHCGPSGYPIGYGEHYCQAFTAAGKAFSSHADCYVGSGLCTLSPKDWLVIVETVGFEQLFSSFEAIKETLITAGKCIEFYAWLAEQALCHSTGICL